jgi:hypothetical protein
MIVLRDHTMQTTHGPQIGLIAERRGRLEDDSTKFLFIQFLQFPRATTARLSLKPVPAILFMALHPAIQRPSIDSVSPGHFSLGQSSQRGVDRTATYLIRGIASLAHRERLIPDSTNRAQINGAPFLR